MPQNDQAKKLQSLKDKVERLEKDVKQVKDLLNVQDNWHTEVRDWIGTKVTVDFNGTAYFGTLKWIDRYTLCLITEPNSTTNATFKRATHIFPKSQIMLWKAEV